MRRFIPWTDIALYGGLAAVSTAGSLWAAFTPQEWTVGAIVAAIIVPLGFIVVAAVVIGGKLLSRPDYHVYGMHVWTADGDQPVGSRMKEAVKHFIETFPGIARAHGFDGRIQSGTLEELFRGVSCEWRSKPLTVFSRWGWSVKDKAGLQSGKSIMVQWLGSITGSAWHHEVGHMVRQLLLHKSVDYRHEDEEWWAAIRRVKEDCKAVLEKWGE